MQRRRFLSSSLALAGALTLPASRFLGAAPPANSAERIAALDSTPLGPSLKLARASLQELDSISDYEADFHKQELIGKKLKESTMRVKVRHKPFSVYMLFGKPHEGREVIYVDGANSGQILAHETGLKSIVGTVSLDPGSPRAMEDNHHPITQFGMQELLKTVIAQWETDTLISGVDVTYYPNARIGSANCKAIETRHPAPVRGAAFHLTRLYIDSATNLPVRVQQYQFPRRRGEAELYEEYTYFNIRTNVGFKDIDFNPGNPNYNY